MRLKASDSSGGKAKSIEDPAAAQGTEEQKLAKFREVRDEIKARVAAFLAGVLLPN